MRFLFARQIGHDLRFFETIAERPFAIDHLSGIQRRRHQFEMVRHFDGDRDQIDLGMIDEFGGIAEAKGISSALAAACADSSLVVLTATTSYWGKARRAGIWAIAAQLRPGCAPIMPTPIFPCAISSPPALLFVGVWFVEILYYSIRQINGDGGGSHECRGAL